VRGEEVRTGASAKASDIRLSWRAPVLEALAFDLLQDPGYRRDGPRSVQSCLKNGSASMGRSRRRWFGVGLVDEVLRHVDVVVSLT
jgi:hypothetical protein